MGMFDDGAYGTRDKRGNWTPSAPVAYPPLFDWPLHPRSVLKWFFGWPGYLFPGNALFAAIAFLCWKFATPPLDRMHHLAAGWLLFLLARNAILTILFFGALQLYLYAFKGQGTSFKYN